MDSNEKSLMNKKEVMKSRNGAKEKKTSMFVDKVKPRGPPPQRRGSEVLGTQLTLPSGRAAAAPWRVGGGGGPGRGCREAACAQGLPLTPHRQRSGPSHRRGKGAGKGPRAGRCGVGSAGRPSRGRAVGRAGGGSGRAVRARPAGGRGGGIAVSEGGRVEMEAQESA
ncbi:uncharacterized protein LOC113963704 [Neopelma chrysocephalum]|uniref:uncharacterized protein LOC113963704 n=1 Tax=Neopelma chrysocephalum TaxID=114329 RepID=UPI000FCD3897|nr:uncharacterized protein LOC113963704 [Neopelma chrysocephalum]